MFELIENQTSVSFIGMCKNAGKTTAMNFLIEECSKRDIVLGITSIGRDGEERDVLHDIVKPKIYVPVGTIVATASECVDKSNIKIKLLEETNISTSLGDVLIFEVLSNGYIEIAGPPYKSVIQDVSKKMLSYGAKKIFIDGALGRKGSADKNIADAVILSAGVAYSSILDTLVDDTAFAVEMLSLPSLDYKIRDLSNVTIIDKEGVLHNLDLKTSLNSAKEIISSLSVDSRYLVLKGAFSSELAEALVINRNKFLNLTIIVENGTKVFIKRKEYNNMLKANIGLIALENINVVAVTINPTSPTGKTLDKELLEAALKDKVNVPVVNVKR